MNSKCTTCQKMLYRTDPCKGVGIETCGRSDGGSKKMGTTGAHATGRSQNVPAAVGKAPSASPDAARASEAKGTAPRVRTKSAGQPVQKLAGPLTEKRVPQGGVSAMSEVATRSFKSTAARKDVPDTKTSAASLARASRVGTLGGHRKVAPSPSGTTGGMSSATGELAAPETAGTQAPPVDALVDQAVTQAKRRGRPISPNPKSKRAEYQRNLMRDKRERDRLKAEKGKTE